MKKLIALKDGKEIEVLVERVGTKTWFHYEGKTTSIESSHGSSRRSGKDSASTHPGQILAPMPGKILKLNSSNESQVKAGDIILIMEAMKMEYSLAADVDVLIDYFCTVLKHGRSSRPLSTSRKEV